ncbi:MAG: Tim44 domain-containing protein [Rhodobacteraceae bacterium]|nr:Tim44 domain-containing protein [Paracoccaceae bacterium]
MNEIFDVYNLILIGLAVFILFKLRSVLGKRTGNERPPFDPYSKPEKSDEKPSAPVNTDAQSGDNVIPLPGQEVPQSKDDGSDKDGAIDTVAPTGSALNEALRQILSVDRSFEPGPFVEGARSAYEMIVTAFADGDRKTLKSLLAKDVYEGFVSAIDEREKRGETVETTFVGIDKAEIVEAALKDGQAQVTVKIQSQLISATKDKDGEVVDGDLSKIDEVVDIWTFARDINSRDPNWKLIGTEAA